MITGEFGKQSILVLVLCLLRLRAVDLEQLLLAFVVEPLVDRLVLAVFHCIDELFGDVVDLRPLHELADPLLLNVVSDAVRINLAPGLIPLEAVEELLVRAASDEGLRLLQS